MKHRTIYKATVLLMLFALGVALVIPTRKGVAYNWWTCDGGTDDIAWEQDEGAPCNGCVVMELVSSSFPQGSEGDNYVQSAMASWNNVVGTSAAISVRYGDNSWDTDNRENEVVVDSLDGPGDTLGVTYLIYNGSLDDCVAGDDANIDEADVVFDSAEIYDRTFRYTSPRFHFTTIAVHEFGHALGLTHENRNLTRMNSFYPNGGPITQGKWVRPIADDRHGIAALYPGGNRNSRADLVASNFVSNRDGSSRLAVSTTWASPGDSIDFESTVMNIGGVPSGNFKIEFYLSSDDRITSADRRIGRATYHLNAYGTLSYTRTLTIPIDVPRGTYYLGVLLDREDVVTEWDDANNDLAQWRTITIR